MEVPDDEMNIKEVSRLVGIRVAEVGGAGEGEEDEENKQLMHEARDDVNGGNCLWEELKRQGGKRLGIW